MFDTLYLIVGTGFLAILYSYIVSKQILSASSGSKKMQEIANAIQEGARAYLNRQYKTIAVVGAIIFIIITYFLGSLGWDWIYYRSIFIWWSWICWDACVSSSKC